MTGPAAAAGRAGLACEAAWAAFAVGRRSRVSGFILSSSTWCEVVVLCAARSAVLYDVDVHRFVKKRCRL